MSAPLKIVNKTRRQGKGKKKRESKPAPDRLLMDNRRKLVKLMLSMLLWQDPVDAGFPPFTNGLDIVLPHPKNDITCFTVVIGGVLCYALSLRGPKYCGLSGSLRWGHNTFITNSQALTRETTITSIGNATR